MTDTIDMQQTTAERAARGEAIIKELAGSAPQAASLDALAHDFPFLSNAVIAFAVGEIFNRTVLDVRTRQLALCTAFAALGLTDYMKIHAGYALNHGATADEVKEIANLVIIPGGFPRAIMASQAITELLASRPS